MLDRVSIELTNACSKGCAFCYNESRPHGATVWTVDELSGFIEDIAARGIQAVSFGGGEPLDYPGWVELLCRTQGIVFRSITTHGLHLDRHLQALVKARPDKVHVSIHHPDRLAEVSRVVRQVKTLQAHGVASGVNLLVRRSGLLHARQCSSTLQSNGIGLDRIMFLPMRGHDTPSAREMGQVAGGRRFQSMTCLLACGQSPRFASIGWDRTVAWCSYTGSRRPLPSLDYAGLLAALNDLGLIPCGPIPPSAEDAEDAEEPSQKA